MLVLLDNQPWQAMNIKEFDVLWRQLANVQLLFVQNWECHFIVF